MSVIEFKRHRVRRPHVRSEGRFGHRQRRREAEQKLRAPQTQPTSRQPLDEMAVHQEERDLHQTHAVNRAIATHATEEATEVRAEEAAAEASLSAREEELHRAEEARDKSASRQQEFVQRIKEQGLGHQLARAKGWLKGFVDTTAVVFETIGVASPLQLYGTPDFGFAGRPEQIVGAVLALVMGFGYAVVLTVLADGVGKELKRLRYRHVLEGDTSDAEAEGWPRPAAVDSDRRVIALALGSLVLAVFSAALVRQVEVRILAGAGQDHALVAWPVFFVLTAAVFIAVLAASYWWSRPIADENDRLKAEVDGLDKAVDAKREACHKLVGKIETCRTRIETIQNCATHDQHGQIHLAVSNLFHRRGANAHVFDIVTDPTHVMGVINNPQDHVHDVQVREVADGIRQRIEEIRSRAKAPQAVDEEAA